MYVDRHPSNQVRHFIGYFTIGSRVSPSIAAQVLATLFDGDEPGDYELGVLAANLAARMRESPQLVSGLGGSVRATLCNAAR
jgi:hypothetical protein